MCNQKDCPIYRKQVEVGYSGNKNAEIVYVVESPGFRETQTRQMLVGDSGNKARQMFNQAGIVWTDLFNINSARCQVIKKEHSDGEIGKILKACRPHVEIALKAIKPKCIIIAGDFALRQILKRKGITNARKERWIYSEEFECWCRPTFHPSYILRNPQLEKDAVADLIDIKNFFANRCKPVVQELVTDYKEVQSIREYIQGARSVGFDTEGQGLLWHNPEYVSLGYGISKSKGTGVFVRLYKETQNIEEACITFTQERLVGKKKVPTEIYVKKCENFDLKLKELWWLLETPKIKKIMQNGKFDVHCVETLFKREYKKVPFIQGYGLDIQIGAQLLDENLYNFADLSTLQHAFTDQQDNYNEEFDKKFDKSDMLAVPFDKVLTYGCRDTDISRQAGIGIAKELLKFPRLVNYLNKFIMPTLMSLAVIEDNGVPIDKDELPKLRDTLYVEMMKAQSEALRLVPKKIKELHAEKNAKKKDGIYLTRGDYIADILFHEDGLRLKPPKINAKSKKPSTDKHVRKELLEKSKSKKVQSFLENVTTFQETRTMISTYLTGFEKHLTPLGKVHSSFSLAIARTGRISSRGPNVTNMPNRGRLAKPFRRIIKAPKGWVFIKVDQSQSELRHMADQANDPVMIQVYNSAEADLHTETAKKLAVKKWGELVDSERKTARQQAKCINFGLLYGMTAYGFMKYAKKDYGIELTMKEAERWVQIFFSTYRRLQPFHRSTIDFCREHGYVESPLGRRRRLPNINSKVEWESKHAGNEAINFPVQSISSDVVLIACNQLLGRTPFNRERFLTATIKETLQNINFNDTRKYGYLNPDECRPFAFIHDELDFMVKDNSRLVDYCKLIKWAMENPPLERDFGVKLKVPLVAELQIGKENLADLEDFVI